MKKTKTKTSQRHSPENCLLRSLPQVDELLRASSIRTLLEEYPRNVVLDSIRRVLESIRSLPRSSLKDSDFNPDSISTKVKDSVREMSKPSLRRVVNATGIILHTGLGRSLLSKEAQEAIACASSSYSNLELRLSDGERQERTSHVEKLLCNFSGAEAAIAVNNNAAAVLLALHTFAFKKEVIVSRGQLVEIGGTFRLPDIIKASGAKLVEVGTTNRTYIRDYEKAINDKTAVLMQVHTSNFRQIGFTAEVPAKELAGLAFKKKLVCINDLGSGALIDLKKYGLAEEPTVEAAVKAGAGLVTFSADKLLGATQAGIAVGKRPFVEAMRKNPLYRAVRIDKLCLAGLEATLRLYLDQADAIKKIPVLETLLRPLEHIEREAEALKTRLEEATATVGKFKIKDGFSQLGGGALSGQDIPTRLVSFMPSGSSADEFSRKLRLNDPPILARIHRDEILIDPRTLLKEDFDIVTDAFRNIIQGG
jgi:L-seryl-tRNA(Ser) seleniumtransferase